ncbi:hypothetical protein H6G45_05840 [Synechocystis sp. FACHB-383]|nr:hypothetical protein [Synechocystis sp. FACHB-383]MBD2653016.1 hypothetical protein [Synechocystis sp. FACHB-383]
MLTPILYQKSKLGRKAHLPPGYCPQSAREKRESLTHILVNGSTYT